MTDAVDTFADDPVLDALDVKGAPVARLDAAARCARRPNSSPSAGTQRTTLAAIGERAGYSHG